MENSDPAKLIRIHPQDNVGVLSRSVRAGERIDAGSIPSVAEEDFGLGHKFALTDIAKGAKVVKYGISIGSATRDIRRGDHVHLHNLQSDYLPTYTLGGERNFEG